MLSILPQITLVWNHWVERWFPEEEKKQIQCPQLISRYNKGMGGVDKADQLISFYRIKIKTSLKTDLRFAALEFAGGD